MTSPAFPSPCESQRRQGRDLLAGNGVALVRERALAARVQAKLQRLYLLDELAPVGDFLTKAEAGEREALLVRAHDDGSIEVAVRIPTLGEEGVDLDDAGELDRLCQIIEGVSHFVYLAERARTARHTTQLELEVQAEVDKYVVVAESLERFGEQESAALRARLFEEVRFVHDASSELGERYRMANGAADRFVHRLEREYLARGRLAGLCDELRRFFHNGQEGKLRLARS